MGDGPAEHRAVRDGGEPYARRQGVDAVLHLAVGLVWGVQPLERPADQPEGAGVLERRVFRRGDSRRAGGQDAIGESAARTVMDDLAGLGPAFGRRHAPVARCSFDQTGARARAGLAQRRPEGADGIGIARRLLPQHRVGVFRCVRRRMLDPHPAPVGVEFLGQDHRDGSVGRLSHLDLRHDQGDPAFPVDPDEGVRREGRRFSRLADPVQRGVEAKKEASGGGHAEHPPARRAPAVIGRQG